MPPVELCGIATSSAAAASSDDKPDALRADEPGFLSEITGMMPSWLASLVFHLALVLLLALVHVVGNGGIGTTITLQTSAPAGDAEDDMLAAGTELPGELAAAEITASEPSERVPQELPSVAGDLLSSPIGLLNPAGGSVLSSDSMAGGSPLGDDATGAGAPAMTSVFGLSDEGQTFVYVFDRSESMNSTLSFVSEGETVGSITPLEAAKTELLRSLGELTGKQRFHIIFYNHEVWMFDTGRGAKRLVAADSRGKQRASSFVGSVYGQGGTRHVRPLEVALRMRPDVIFLLTDGEPKDDPSDTQLAAIKRLNDGRTKINVIQFVHTPITDSKLVQLATENGGRHRFFNLAKLAPTLIEIGKQPPQPIDLGK